LETCQSPPKDARLASLPSQDANRTKTDGVVLLQSIPNLEKVLREPFFRERDAVDSDSFSNGDEVRGGVET